MDKKDMSNVMQVLLIGNHYQKVIKAVQDGYPIDLFLLETLRRLHKIEVLYRVCKIGAQRSPGEYSLIRQYLVEFFGEEKKDYFFDRIKKEQENAEKTAFAAALEAANGILTADFLESVSEKNWEDRLFEHFSEDDVYEFLEKENLFNRIALKFSAATYYRHGNFQIVRKDLRLFRSCYFCIGHECLTKVIKEILSYEGGFDEIFNAKIDDDALDGILLAEGEKDKFLARKAYKRLLRCEALELEDWKLWYQENKKEALEYARRYNEIDVLMQFKDRWWLFKHGYWFKALKC